METDRSCEATSCFSVGEDERRFFFRDFESGFVYYAFCFAVFMHVGVPHRHHTDIH
jgi:hypothetical protein